MNQNEKRYMLVGRWSEKNKEVYLREVFKDEVVKGTHAFHINPLHAAPLTLAVASTFAMLAPNAFPSVHHVEIVPFDLIPIPVNMRKTLNLNS